MSLPLESGSNFDLSREINLFGIRTALKLEFVKDIIDTYDITKIKTTIIALTVVFNLKDFELSSYVTWSSIKTITIYPR